MMHIRANGTVTICVSRWCSILRISFFTSSLLLIRFHLLQFLLSPLVIPNTEVSQQSTLTRTRYELTNRNSNMVKRVWSADFVCVCVKVEQCEAPFHSIIMIAIAIDLNGSMDIWTFRTWNEIVSVRTIVYLNLMRDELNKTLKTMKMIHWKFWSSCNCHIDDDDERWRVCHSHSCRIDSVIRLDGCLWRSQAIYMAASYGVELRMVNFDRCTTYGSRKYG